MARNMNVHGAHDAPPPAATLEFDGQRWYAHNRTELARHLQRLGFDALPPVHTFRLPGVPGEHAVFVNLYADGRVKFGGDTARAHALLAELHRQEGGAQ